MEQLGSPPLATLLSTPISSLPTLLALLTPPLAALSLLPDRPDLVALHPSSSPSIDRRAFLKRQLGLVQKVLVETIWPDWEHALEGEEEGLVDVVLRRWFVPPTATTPEQQELAVEVALSSYAVITSVLSRRTTPLLTSVLTIISSLIADLSTSYNLAPLYLALFPTITAAINPREQSKAVARWDATLKDVFAVPAKVANAWGALSSVQSIPTSLTDSNYTATLITSYLSLLTTLASSPPSDLTPLATPLRLLPIPSPSFFPSLIPLLLPPSFPATTEALLHRKALAQLWRSLLFEFGGGEQRKIVRAFLIELERKAPDVRGGTWLIGEMVGFDEESAAVLLDVVLEKGRSWDPRVARMVVGWATAADELAGDDARWTDLLHRTLKEWAEPSGIKNGSEQMRLYLTTLLLTTLYALPPNHPTATAISRSSPFLAAVSAHLSLLRPTPRLLGMLVVELLSVRTLEPGGTVEPLSFGSEIWDGEEEGKDVVRVLRASLATKEPPTKNWQEALREAWKLETVSTKQAAPRRRAIPPPSPIPSLPTKRPLISIIDDPNDLAPYPLPPAPSESYLSTLASDDPSLYATALPSGAATETRRRGKLRAPVYIPELVAYLKGKEPEGGKEQADEEAERVEMALKEGEALVRRKRGWGGELEENAVDLAFALMGLQDQFELEGFDQAKQQILTALVASCPTKVAPAIIEQYFVQQYSTAQRYTMLTSLALAARELALLPALTLQAAPPADTFPSKRLPPALHHRLVVPTTPSPSLPPGALEALTASLTSAALSSTKSETEATLPLASRTKLLSVRRFASAPAPTESGGSYPSLAASTFVLPLINWFWLHLRDTSTSRSSDVSALLAPLTLSKFLSTLSILLHAARHAPEFLHVLVPETVELVLSLRGPAGEGDPVVLESEMEILLVVMDAMVEIDGGDALVRRVERGGEMLGEVREWAEEVFVEEERAGVGRAGRAAAGVLLRVEEVERRWRGRVGW